MTIEFAASILANAAVSAGIINAQVLSVTILGSSLSGELITPDGRRFTVLAETRVFNVTE